MKTLAFFTPRGGVGKTTLAYHVGHMLAELGHPTLLVDLDPQATLTAMCVGDERLEALWAPPDDRFPTLSAALRTLGAQVDRAISAPVEQLRDGLALVPGDIGLATFEDSLQSGLQSGPDELTGRRCRFDALRPFFDRVGADTGAEFIVVDLAPSVGPMNRAALLATDFLITPVAPDPFSVRALQTLGPLLAGWRAQAQAHPPRPDHGHPMTPLGYVVTQVAVRMGTIARAYDRWLHEIPRAFSQFAEALGVPARSIEARDPWVDPSCLGTMRNFYSLVILAYEARKPVFDLRPGDGALGAHLAMVETARLEFEAVTREIVAASGRTPPMAATLP